MRLKWTIAWVLVLALLAGPAFALGLGQIQVRSQYGEPFLAEIPIVSSDPAELRQLQARLASPDTFARIGLQPPQGVVSDLQFNVALDASGRPVIRVTSAAPVEQPLLTFLIEADWGQGRLVREYSALLDAPDTVAAPAQPPIQAPVLDAGDRIVRPPEPQVSPLDGEPGPEAVAAEEPASQPEPEPVAEAEAEAAEQASPPAPVAAAPAPAPAPVAAAASVPGEYGPVQAGDTLSQIVQRLARDDDVSLNQMMLALLRANPEAFIGGNVNLLRQGAVLRMPERDEALRLSMAEATAEVRSQVTRWREMSAPVPQPADAAVADASAVPAAGMAADADGASQAPAGTADARLEITPPSAAGGQQAGTRSGISAGGEGEMLRQELQETRESLAARDAEVEELRARLAEIEQLQQQQQQLIELKDSELAAVQQRLAESNQQPAPTLAQANQPQDAAPAVQEAGGAPWLWIGLGLVLLIAAALAWARTRREREAPVVRRRGGASSPASGRGGVSPTWHAGGPGGAATAASAAATPAAPEPTFMPAPPMREETAEPAARSGSEPEPEPEPEPDDIPVSAPASASAAEPIPLTGMEERLELAKAYVELGDVDTARGLLQEVSDAGAAPESEEAARLLRELG